MKKCSYFFLAIAFTVLCLTACSDTNVNSDDKDIIVAQDEVEVDLPDFSQVTDISKTYDSSDSQKSTDDGGGMSIDVPIQNQNNDPNAYAYDEEVTLFRPETDMNGIIAISSEQTEKVSAQKIWIQTKLGDFWHASGVNGTTDAIPALYDASTSEVVNLTTPEDFPEWVAGSGYYLILQDRYWIEWLSYEDSTMKLTIVDSQTKTLEVLREESDESYPAFLYLKALDDEHFLSYYKYYAPEGDEFDIYSVCEIYDIDGNYTEIVREGFKYDEENSVGFYYDAFTAEDGKIYALGKQIVNGKAQWSLRTLSNDGEVTSVKSLNNFSYMFGTGNVDVFDIVNGYIVTRNSWNQPCCIFKKDNLVFKGTLYNSDWEITDDLIVWGIRKDENGNELENYLIYVIDTNTDEIRTYTFLNEEGIDLQTFGLLKCGNGDICVSCSIQPTYVRYVIPKEVLY